MEWISDYDEGKLKVLINSYLPVVGLLSLIMILPIVFQAIAMKYEKRKNMLVSEGRALLFTNIIVWLALFVDSKGATEIAEICRLRR